MRKSKREGKKVVKKTSFTHFINESKYNLYILKIYTDFENNGEKEDDFTPYTILRLFNCAIDTVQTVTAAFTGYQSQRCVFSLHQV